MPICLAILILLLSAISVFAQQIAAAGRLEFTEKPGSCSAALIRPNVIVTAAHCAGANPEEGLIFRPGDGRNGKTYPIRRFVRHPLYDRDSSRVEWLFRFDIAVAELSESVSELRAIPLPQGDDARVGEMLFIVSWRDGEGDRPRQRACPVIEGLTGLVTLGCNVVSGESGAPVIRKTDRGLEIVAVISSRGSQLQQPVAQASDVRLRIPPLLDALDSP